VEAERRQITVLFADVVGFTTFSERSGEEAAFTLMRQLAKLMDEAVREQRGVVQGFTGDGIMAVFGAPIAFEDAPLRACRAALSILQKVKASGADLEIKMDGGRNCASASTPGWQWSARCRAARTPQ
jgi:class 3 adenylate cyclase